MAVASAVNQQKATLKKKMKACTFILLLINRVDFLHKVLHQIAHLFFHGVVIGLVQRMHQLRDGDTERFCQLFKCFNGGAVCTFFKQNNIGHMQICVFRKLLLCPSA